MVGKPIFRDVSQTKPSKALAVLAKYNLGTVLGIEAATAALERGMTGYVRPLAHGSGVITSSGNVKVEIINERGHDLPAMILAAACGYVSGTEAFALSREQLSAAISAMAPAAACPAFKHPNIVAWRRIVQSLGRRKAQKAVAVFIDENGIGTPNSIIQAFVSALRQRKGLTAILPPNGQSSAKSK